MFLVIILLSISINQSSTYQSFKLNVVNKLMVMFSFSYVTLTSSNPCLGPVLTINYKNSVKCRLQLESPVGDSQTKFSARNSLCTSPTELKIFSLL